MLKFTTATERFIKENLAGCDYNVDRLIDEANGQRATADSEDMRQEYITIQDELSIIKYKGISLLDITK